MKEAQFTVHGISPLLTHNPASMFDKPTGTRGSNIPAPEEEAERATYRTVDGHLGLPGMAVRAAIVKTAGAWKRGTKSKVAHILVTEDTIPITKKNSHPVTDYTIDARRVMIQRAGVIRHRPRFDDWYLSFTILYDETLEDVSEDLLRGLLQDAGARIGLGDFRPQTGGPFGRFEVL